jgi:hypothetical protein
VGVLSTKHIMQQNNISGIHLGSLTYISVGGKCSPFYSLKEARYKEIQALTGGPRRVYNIEWKTTG